MAPSGLMDSCVATRTVTTIAIYFDYIFFFKNKYITIENMERAYCVCRL
jgi:hypothetical protein